MKKMKTTLDIDDELLLGAKALAARERSSITALIEEGLRLRLRGREAKSRGRKLPALAIYRGKGGLTQGISSLSNRSLLDSADAGRYTSEDVHHALFPSGSPARTRVGTKVGIRAHIRKRRAGGPTRTRES
jgi:hypothetical protein